MITCVQHVAIAAPRAPCVGINKILIHTFATTPPKEIKLSAFRFPFAVRSVPKIKFMEIGKNPIIKNLKGAAASEKSV